MLITPAIRALKQQTGGHVTVLTKAKYAHLLSGNPHIDEIVALEGNLLGICLRLARGRFTHIIDLHNNVRSRLLALLLFWIPALRTKKAGRERTNLIKKRSRQMPPLHVVDRHYKAIAKLGCQTDGKGLDYTVQNGDRVDYRQIPILQYPFTAVAIGGQHKTKQMPLNKLIELLRSIEGPVVILGSEAEKEVGQKAAGTLAIEGRWNLYNACGELTLPQSASVLEQAAEVYSNDTGLMHIAAALGKRVHSVWGSTVPAFGMYPYGTDFTVADVAGLPCRPCHKHGFEACPLGHFKCMQHQDFSLKREWLNTNQPDCRSKMATLK